MTNSDRSSSPDPDSEEFGPAVVRSEMRNQRADDYRQAGLSQRQAEVQTLREEGLSHEEIAAELDVALGTVKSHCDRIDYKIRTSRYLTTLADQLPDNSLTATEFRPSTERDDDAQPTVRGWSLANGAEDPEYEKSHPIEASERTIVCDQCGFTRGSVEAMMDHLDSHR